MIAARAFLLALLVCWGFTASADVAVPPLSGRVVDQTGTLSSDTIASLTQTLKGLELRKGSQVAVLIVPTTAPETIEQYSIRVAEAWKIGRKKIDDGALLVVAKDDHKLRIEVGYGLEGSLTDASASRIINEVITPKFRSGDFAGGISDGVERIIGVIDGEPLPAPEPQQSYDSPGRIDMLFNPLILFGVFVAGGLLRTLLGRLIGAVATGGVVGLLVWFFVGSLALSIILAIGAAIFSLFASSAASNARTGGWSGGGGSFSSGGSSSSSGGFSGGGGSFGGGGASGSW
jgi:uncharacterized protein